jgi:hypothetical protein
VDDSDDERLLHLRTYAKLSSKALERYVYALRASDFLLFAKNENIGMTAQVYVPSIYRVQIALKK